MTNCTLCNDSGILWAYNRFDASIGPYVFRCRCPKGDGRNEPWTQWREIHFKRYVPEDAKDSPKEVEFRQRRKDKADRKIFDLMEKRDFTHPILLAFERYHGKEKMRVIWERFSK